MTIVNKYGGDITVKGCDRYTQDIERINLYDGARLHFDRQVDDACRRHIRDITHDARLQNLVNAVILI